MTSRADRRGRYDRHLSPLERSRAARRLVLRCAIEQLADHGAPLRVVDLARAARLSRRTIYEHFIDGARLERLALRLACRHAEEALRAATRRAVTPIERLRALAQAWCTLAAADDPCGRLALRQEAALPRAPTRPGLERALAVALQAARRDGLIARAPDVTTLTLIAMAWTGAAAAQSEAPQPNVLAERLAECAWRLAR